MMTTDVPVRITNRSDDLREADERLDGQRADRAWRAGDFTEAMDVADSALAHGADPDCLAAGVAAAASAADGCLLDAGDRWRSVASKVEGVPRALAAGRAALAAGLAGDAAAAERDLAAAAGTVSGAAPRSLSVLLDGVAATLAATQGEFSAAARRLAGLAVARVAADPMAVAGWADLAVTVTVAGGNDAMARDMLAAASDRLTTRQRLVKAWLDLRTGRLADARAGLTSVGGASVLRRDAVLAAVVTVGIARRAGDGDTLRAAWHRVAPVVAGADVEPLLLDAWGELSVAAALVAPVDADLIVTAMAAAVTRAGGPPWGAAALAWWASQRAAATGEREVARAAAERLATLAGSEPAGGQLTVRAAAAAAWAATLGDHCDGHAVLAAAEALANIGRPWEAATLCAAAAKVATSATARDLLAAGRALRATVITEEGGPAGGLSKRERLIGELLLDGLTHKEIGARLYLSPKTVEHHVARLRQKLDASSRAEFVAALRTTLAR
jgi:DNA-binding CsgD family transcriptional regulator